MATVRERMNEAAQKLAAHPEAVEGVQATYKLVLSGEGGGTWLMTLKRPPSLVETDGDADCTIRVAASDYLALMEGRVQAPALFFAGKLQIEGDLSLAMKLGALTAALH